MEKTYNLNIITPDKLVYAGQITSLTVPSSKGYLGVLANHDRLITDISRGQITLKEEAGQLKIFNFRGQGFLEVSRNNATLLLDSHPSPQ